MRNTERNDNRICFNESKPKMKILPNEGKKIRLIGPKQHFSQQRFVRLVTVYSLDNLT